MNDRIKIFESKFKNILEMEINDWIENSKGIAITSICTDIKNDDYVVYIHYKLLLQPHAIKIPT